MLFSEIYSAYFNAVAAMVDEAIEGRLTETRMLELMEEKAFSESMLTILPAVKQEEWLVINRELQTPLRRPPQMPLTLLQKRWLKSLLTDPRIALFSPDTAGLEDIEPLFRYEDFVFFDRYADGDPYADEAYIRQFRCVLSALQEQRRIYIAYRNRHGKQVQGSYVPQRLEYSAKDDKFRLLTADGRFAAYINLGRITECRLLEPFAGEHIDPPRRRESAVRFMLTDQRNALDRVMLHFSDCRKETRRAEDNTYQVTLWYDPLDETELLIRLLSFGPVLRVTQPKRMVNLIKERLSMQMRLLP